VKLSKAEVGLVTHLPKEIGFVGTEPVPEICTGR
jgi:hypothetical protein